MKPPTESQIQEACAHILELDGWRRLRTDPVSRREWGKGFGEKGMADDLFLRYRSAYDRPGEGGMPLAGMCVAQVIWIEWKRLLPQKRGKTWPRSTQAAIHQQAWHTLERKRGASTLIAGQDFPASVDG